MIQVQHDGEGMAVRELCCFCYSPTNHWCVAKDVAVCQACAQTHTLKQVPSKKVWWEAVERRLDEQARQRGLPMLHRSRATVGE